MGLTLQFAIGEKQQIIDAVRNFDFDFLEQLESENKLADFSLHIEPNDLNLLVNAATELINVEAFGLREHLDTTQHYVDSQDGGAFLVDKVITSLFAKLNESDADEITNMWFQKMADEHNEELEVNDDAIKAVLKLIVISKIAQELDLELIHIWYL